MEQLKPFIQLANESESTEQFLRKAKKMDVPNEVSEFFEEEYGANGMLSIEKATELFIEDVNDGKFEYIENPYLYSRQEIYK